LKVGIQQHMNNHKTNIKTHLDSKLLLDMHLKSSHDGSRFKCDEVNCDYITEIKASFKMHKRSHTKPYQCDFCNKRFASKSRISIHISHKHSTSDQVICGNQLETHQEAKPFQCDICVKRFALKTQMIVHQSIEHQSESGK